MGTADLRPLTLGELLDRTFTLYRNNFWLFVGIMAIPSAFSIPSTALILSMQGFSGVGGRPSPTFFLDTFLLVAFFFLLFWIVYSIAIGAATYAVSETYLGRKATVRGAYSKAGGKLLRIFGVVTVAGLRVLGMMLVVSICIGILVASVAGIMAVTARGQSRAIIGIIVGITIVLAYLTGIGLWVLWSLRYAVSIPALLLENLGVLAAIRRSVKLTRGRRWQLLIAIMLCSMIAYAGVIVFQGPFFVTMMLVSRGGHVPEWLTYTLATSGAIGGAITGPILMIVLVLCYYDTRIRKEAFDLQFMMSLLDAAVPVPEPTSPV